MEDLTAVRDWTVRTLTAVRKRGLTKASTAVLTKYCLFMLISQELSNQKANAFAILIRMLIPFDLCQKRTKRTSHLN